MNKFACTFSKSQRFVCLEKCGYCCSYKIALTPQDIPRIDRLESTEQHWYRPLSDKERMLKDTGYAGVLQKKKDADYCTFLSPDKLCTIYDCRPTVCRAYPFYRDIYYQIELDIDYSCPGLQFGNRLKKQDLQNVLLLFGTDDQHRADLEGQRQVVLFLETTIRSIGRFIDYSLLQKLWNQLYPLLVHAQHQFDFQTLLERGTLLAGRIRRNIFDENQIQEFFTAIQKPLHTFDKGRGLDIPFWQELIPWREYRNTHLIQDTLIHYTLHRDEDRYIYTSDDEYSMHRDEIEPTAFTPQALQSAAKYLDMWAKRQLLIRFIHGVTLSSVKPENMLYYYMGFLHFLTKRIQKTAWILAGIYGSQEITQDILEETCRLFDGYLRTKCMAINIQQFENTYSS